MSGDPWDDDDLDPEPDGKTVEELMQLLDAQENLLIAVATGGPRINSVDHEYRGRRRKLRSGLQKLGVPDPFPWSDLWRWYGEWSSNLPSYQDRRVYVREKSDAARDQLEQISSPAADDPGATHAGWPGLEERLTGVKQRLETAETVDDRQDIGRRCREILIDLAGVVFSEEILTADEEVPKGSDAKARLTYAARFMMPGRAHDEWRSLIRSAWDLANKLTHSDSTSDVDAFASVQVTILLVRCFERVAEGAGVGG